MERIETWAVARRWAWVPAAVLLLPLMVACAAPAVTHLDCPLGVSLDGISAQAHGTRQIRRFDIPSALATHWEPVRRSMHRR